MTGQHSIELGEAALALETAAFAGISMIKAWPHKGGPSLYELGVRAAERHIGSGYRNMGQTVSTTGHTVTGMTTKVAEVAVKSIFPAGTRPGL